MGLAASATYHVQELLAVYRYALLVDGDTGVLRGAAAEQSNFVRGRKRSRRWFLFANFACPIQPPLSEENLIKYPWNLQGVTMTRLILCRVPTFEAE